MTAPMTIADEAVQAAKPTEGYLIVKRDLYYRPNSCGYTGIRDEAGRYSLEFVEDLCSHKGDGLSFIHESEAPEFRDAAFHDLVIKHLIKQRDEARAALPFLQDVKVKALGWVDRGETVTHQYKVDTICGVYYIERNKSGLFDWWSSTTRGKHEAKTLEAAKAAAQADYQARILSAIEAAPSPRAQALDSAVVNCAKNLLCSLDPENDLDNPEKFLAWHSLNGAILDLSSQPVADGWLPIETAPKDGTMVLLGWNDPDTNEIGAVAGWYEGGPADECWYDQYHEPVTVTHWMPLRPLPASPGVSNQTDAEAIAENYLQEIQDGAWGDNPRTRGLARDRLNITRTTGGSDADA